MKKELECDCLQFFEEYIDENGSKQRKIKGKIPVYGTEYAACADVALPEDVIIRYREVKKIDLCIGFIIPKGYKIIMYPRSSLLIKKGLFSPVSIIDQDYSGQRVHVVLANLLKDYDVDLKAGERVAQIECVPAYHCSSWITTENERTGGFGSTGEVDVK